MQFKLTGKKGTPVKVDRAQLKVSLLMGAIVLVGVFCLFGTKTLLAKASYQQKLISANNKTARQLKTNLTAAASLTSQYKGLFENTNPANFLGGKNDSSSSAVPPNVDNARLAIDALPTTYDYPALVASLTKIMSNAGVSNPNINGTDETTTVDSTPAAQPTPQTITLTISGEGTYASVQQVLNTLEHSIRPFDVSTLTLTGSDSDLNFSATVNSYFQPAKTLGMTTQEVR